MPARLEGVRCGKCGAELHEAPGTAVEQRAPCPSCGSLTRQFAIGIASVVTPRSKVKFKGRHAGGGRPFVEAVVGSDLHYVSDVWMRLERVLDRADNRYREVVVNRATGAIVHECDEPLSAHRGHGAARGRRGAPVA